MQLNSKFNLGDKVLILIHKDGKPVLARYIVINIQVRTNGVKSLEDPTPVIEVYYDLSADQLDIPKGVDSINEDVVWHSVQEFMDSVVINLN